MDIIEVGGGGGLFVKGSVGEVRVLQDALLSHPATARPPHLTAFTHSVTHSHFSVSVSFFVPLACFWSPTQPRLTLDSQEKERKKNRKEMSLLFFSERGRKEWKEDKLKTSQSLKLFSFCPSSSVHPPSLLPL